MSTPADVPTPAGQPTGSFSHPGLTHRDGTQCIWDGESWFVPTSAGGEGYDCEHAEHAEIRDTEHAALRSKGLDFDDVAQLETVMASMWAARDIAANPVDTARRIIHDLRALLGSDPADTGASERDEFKQHRFERNIEFLVDAEQGGRCVTCGHVKHNDLGYCQVGQCPCSSGTTVSGTARILRRDLPELLDAVRAAERERIAQAIEARRTHDASYSDYRDHARGMLKGFTEAAQIARTPADGEAGDRDA